MKYLKLSFDTADATEREILVAMLAEAGFESFEEEGNLLHAYIDEAGYDDNTAEVVTHVYQGAIIRETIEQQNWNAAWEEGFHPVTVEGFCTIRAGFHQPDNSVPYEIIITPKMSFGTGHHATTRLMIQQMRDMDLVDKDVLDFGTGTGVLAILAKKLGAKCVTAIDNDEWSYENTLENAAANNSGEIEVLRGSLEVVTGRKYDVILANINRHILMQYMQEMSDLLRPGGMLVMSGILEQDETIVTTEAGKAGFSIQYVTHEDKWSCISATR